MPIGRLALLALAAWQPPNPAKCLLGQGITAAQANQGLCGFDAATLRFTGTPADQARCLTRHVGRGGTIGGPQLPAHLAQLIGLALPFAPERVAAYVQALGLTDRQLGGPLSRPLAADYFIIHDTSSPNCSQLDDQHEKLSECDRLDAFPADRDKRSWSGNQTFEGRPKQAPNRAANVFTNRVGNSVTEVDFADPFYTTKFEQCANEGRAIGHFVGIENIQPRLPSPVPPPSRERMNDLDAPDPGFTDPQYARLALLYIVASTRHGRWLIPAYHAVVDSLYLDRHDDPQKFDVGRFDAAIAAHLKAMR
ncbi:hypothetical protein [Sphingomonas sp. MMS24-J13]|uniref:hypothetical protein n=1 Tax=Sphingomonas sp. MMS24-J13 TaxID=3238686 RepID=UPI00384DD162